MKNYFLLIIVVFSSTFITYSQSLNNYGKPSIRFESIEKDFMKWWVYHLNNITLSSNFTAIDNTSNIISKEVFLKNLTSGDFIPLKLISKDNTTYYKLFKLDQTSDKDIRSTIKNTSSISYKHFKMKGMKFPEFNFKDLNGTEFNNENTKGKIIILKCWFIACKPCVAEFPELNELVEKYQSRDDILFISLAYDSEDKLRHFLSRNPFNYKVASVSRDFFNKQLKINAYPTHFIIDKNGVIRKVVNKVDELILELESKNVLKNLTKRQTPPPPKPKT